MPLNRALEGGCVCHRERFSWPGVSTFILKDPAGAPMKSKNKSLVELGRTLKDWCAGKISDDQYYKRVARIKSEMERTARLKSTFREIDSRHKKKGSPVVQGGLPSLGKHQ